MDVLKHLLLISVLVPLVGCQTGYLIKNGIEQAKLLSQRVDVATVLKDPKISEETKSKIRIAQKARTFAKENLHLKDTQNYTTYVQLDRDYVTYLVIASPIFELKAYEWTFPIVGSVPYKGFFSSEEADLEAKHLKEVQNLDTSVRGVSAYSTLGWFEDPLFSSMMKYSEHQLVNTVIHETVHATIFIKNAADFNERLATFIGNIGTDAFYKNLEGADSSTLQTIRDENEDEKQFAKFITRELKEIEKYYSDNTHRDLKARELYFEGIKERFHNEILPSLKTKQYAGFEKKALNNAVLVHYKTYFHDLADFEVVFNSMDRNFERFLNYCKSLEKQERPQEALTQLAQSVLRVQKNDSSEHEPR